MKLELIRQWFTEQSTIGELYINGHYECFTLEDAVRDEKIAGKTAIPYGTYKVIIDFSNRFQRLMPHILDVPNFEGIRIHKGNTDKDVSGCVSVGLVKGKDFIGHSRDAFQSVYSKLNTDEDVTIAIVGL